MRRVEHQRVIPGRCRLDSPIRRLRALSNFAPPLANLKRVDERAAFDRDRIVPPTRYANVHRKNDLDPVTRMPAPFNPVEGAGLEPGDHLTIDSDAGARRPTGD